MLFETAAREYMDDKGRRLRACTLAGYEAARRPRTMGAGQVRSHLRALWGHECDTDGIVYLTHMYGQDEIVWATVDVSVTFAA